MLAGLPLESDAVWSQRLGDAYQSALVPLDALLLVGIGVGETVNSTGLASEETVKVGTDLVALTLLQVVALSAAGLEKVGTLLAVTCIMPSAFAFSLGGSMIIGGGRGRGQ